MFRNILLGRYPVTELQHYLREISRCEKQLPSINPDGIYGPETKIAVMEFQKLHNLEPTGTVNEATWNAIVINYRYCMLLQGEPATIGPFPSVPGAVIKCGDTGDVVYTIQLIINKLSKRFANFHTVPVTGVYDQPTIDMVKEVQYVTHLPVTGEVDKLTWNALASLYEFYK